MPTIDDLIERVVNGEDANEVVAAIGTEVDEDNVDEKGTISIDAKYVKPQGKYKTQAQAARAIAARIIRNKHGDDKVNDMAAKGIKKYFKGKGKK
jgi:hypothetical protein